MRYSRSLPSGGRSRTILYCQDDGGMPVRPGLKSTTCPTLNLCCRTRFVGECNCQFSHTHLVNSVPERRKKRRRRSLHRSLSWQPKMDRYFKYRVKSRGAVRSRLVSADAIASYARDTWQSCHFCQSACNCPRSSPYPSGPVRSMVGRALFFG
jgi:hypothetical protein